MPARCLDVPEQMSARPGALEQLVPGSSHGPSVSSGRRRACGDFRRELRRGRSRTRLTRRVGAAGELRRDRPGPAPSSPGRGRSRVGISFAPSRIGVGNRRVTATASTASIVSALTACDAPARGRARRGRPVKSSVDAIASVAWRPFDRPSSARPRTARRSYLAPRAASAALRSSRSPTAARLEALDRFVPEAGLGQLGVLVNNAGVTAIGSRSRAAARGLCAIARRDDERRFFCSRVAGSACSPGPRLEHHISSINATEAFPQRLAYCAAKARVESIDARAGDRVAPAAPCRVSSSSGVVHNV